jgi:hypothetical protein
MKRLNRCKLQILILAVIIISGCNKSSSSYYPLITGYKWEYQLIGNGDENRNYTISNMPSYKLEGKKVTPQQVKLNNGNNFFIFISEDQGGIFVFAKQTPDMETPKVLEKSYLIPYPIKVGYKWHEEAMTNLLNKNVPISLIDSIESINETVEVPGGLFHNCLKIINFGTTKKPALIWGYATINVKNISWYAPGVGLIKEIDKEESNSFIYGSGETIVQLVSFNKK